MLKVKSKNLRKGSLLIEAIVGLSIAVTGMIGVFGLLSRSLSINKDISQKLTAIYLGAEGIEVVKSLIDTNIAGGNIWNAGIIEGDYDNISYDTKTLSSPGVGGTPSAILFDEDQGVYNYTTGLISPFRRVVKITDISADEIKVISEVEWLEHGSAKKISLEDHFFNWR